MIKELINLANELDKKGLRKEADYLDALVKRASSGDFSEEGEEEELGADLQDNPEQLSLPLPASSNQNSNLLQSNAPIETVIEAVNNMWRMVQDTREKVV